MIIVKTKFKKKNQKSYEHLLTRRVKQIACTNEKVRRKISTTKHILVALLLKVSMKRSSEL